MHLLRGSLVFGENWTEPEVLLDSAIFSRLEFTNALLARRLLVIAWVFPLALIP